MSDLDLFAWAVETAKKAPKDPVVHRFEAREPSKIYPPAPPPIAAPDGSKRAPLNKPLRDYQTNFREAVHANFKVRKRGLGLAATGAGKTVVFSAIAADYAPARTLILTDQEDLVDQAVEKIHGVTGLYADVEQADRRASLSATIVVSTVQSLRKRLGKFPKDHFALVICDECDKAVSRQWQEVLAHFDVNAAVLGVTATPKRSDRKCILRYFEEKVFEIGLLELIERGFLSPVTVAMLALNVDLSDAERKDAGDYDDAILSAIMRRAFKDVVEQMKEHVGNRSTLVFTPDVESSKAFAEIALAAGWNAAHVDGASPDRREKKKAFSEGKIQILSNPYFLSRGYDEPRIECIINLRPTRSMALYWQIIGRGTRLYCPHGCGGPCEHEDRKKDVLVLDFLCQFKQLGPLRPSCLLADTDAKREAMDKIVNQAQGKLDLRDILKAANTQIKHSLLDALEAAQKATRGRAGEYFNALQWAANLGLDDLMDYEPTTDKEGEPPTDRQLKKLSKLGFIPDSVTCRGHADRVLSALQERKEAGLASMKQVFWLRKAGYRNPESLSCDEAKERLTKYFRQRGKF